jgi:hypothetical protein
MTGVRIAYRGVALSKAITGRLQNRTYYYRVKAIKAGDKDSAWGLAPQGCAVPGTAKNLPAGVPVVPASDGDGAYSVSWAASKSVGVSYFVQEATSADFTQGVRSVYFGTGLSADITGRAAGKSYYYRVQTVRAGKVDSAIRTGGNGCVVGP